MKAFVNHIEAERALAEVFASERSRYYWLACATLTVGAAAGAALGAVWLGLVLMVHECRAALAKRAAAEAGDARAALRSDLALDIASNAALATGPALAWYSRAPFGAPLGLALLGALLIAFALNARRGLVYGALGAAPFAVIGLAFVVDGAFSGAGASALVCVVLAGLAFAAVLRAADIAYRERAHAKEETRALIAQFNSALGPVGGAAWEADFTERRLDGAGALEAALGRAVDFHSVVEAGCFALDDDRALVCAAFDPPAGPTRRFAIEHAYEDGAGRTRRARHEGLVHTGLDGAPARITCITRPLDAAPAEAGAAALDAIRHAAMSAGAAIAAQEELLRTLANELSEPLAIEGAVAPAAFSAEAPFEQTCADIAALLAGLAEREARIEASVEALARARHASESANLAKSQFLANMSHELRTPLNAVIGYAEILREDAEDRDDASAIKDIDRILFGAKHLLGLINEILDLSKIEAGRVEVIATHFDPRALLAELIETVRPLADKNGNEIRFIAPDADMLAQTDSMKLRQCALNLLSNACKFTHGGVVEVTLERRRETTGDMLVCAVRDTGIGMSAEQVTRLFQPFVQADPSITQQYGGTGLGLTITRRLAEVLGGTITVASALGEGSLFTLAIPSEYAAARTDSRVDPLQGPEDAPLIVVIEDEADARDLAARALTRAGFSVLGVGAGEAGLNLARTRAPALVLLDIFLPDRSGWRVLQSLKNDPKTCAIPVIVLSVNDDRAHALSLGAAEHIVKPADRDALAAAVMRFARRQGAEPAPARLVALAPDPGKAQAG